MVRRFQLKQIHVQVNPVKMAARVRQVVLLPIGVPVQQRGLEPPARRVCHVIFYISQVHLHIKCFALCLSMVTI